MCYSAVIDDGTMALAHRRPHLPERQAPRIHEAQGPSRETCLLCSIESRPEAMSAPHLVLLSDSCRGDCNFYEWHSQNAWERIKNSAARSERHPLMARERDLLSAGKSPRVRAPAA